jgi:hypothetical protein
MGWLIPSPKGPIAGGVLAIVGATIAWSSLEFQSNGKMTARVGPETLGNAAETAVPRRTTALAARFR